MTLRELYEALEERIPASLCCPWDNDGVMLCLDWDRTVRKVLTCLDVTESCVMRAKEENVDLILSHHPMIFHPFKRLDCRDDSFRLVSSLIESKIGVFSYHTRLDAVSGGLNDCLAKAIGIMDAKTLETEEGPLARLGQVEKCAPLAFAQRICSLLHSPVRCFEGRHPVRKVMSVCGGGKDFIPLALQIGADAFVSGDISYNVALTASEQGLTVIDAGHRGTELLVCGLFSEMLSGICPEVLVLEHPFGGEETIFLP